MHMVEGIEKIGSEVLRQTADPVKEVDGDISFHLYLKMSLAMYKYGGIGLAAPQVGVSKRVIVIDDGGDAFMMINPRITWKSKELSSFDEACLSVPDEHGEVIRPVSIKVKFQDKTGKYKHWKLDGLKARVVQHEIDHLDGILFVDYLEK